MVLAKRAFSSARSLATSLERRMAGLDRRGRSGQHKAHCPSASKTTHRTRRSCRSRLHSSGRMKSGGVAAGFSRRRGRAEQRAQDACAAAHRAARARAGHHLHRVSRHAGCDRDEIGGHRRITTLHGGQTAHERRAVGARVHRRRGRRDDRHRCRLGRVELQGACRLVVNLELPWNPIRLEQRIGRVDRIGQTRTVHAINLFAEGTAERTVLASLLRRIDRIRMSEIDIAACVIDRSEPPAAIRAR